MIYFQNAVMISFLIAQEVGSLLYAGLLFSLVWLQIQLNAAVHCKLHTSSDLDPFAERTLFFLRKKTTSAEPAGKSA